MLIPPPSAIASAYWMHEKAGQSRWQLWPAINPRLIEVWSALRAPVTDAGREFSATSSRCSLGHHEEVQSLSLLPVT